MAIQNRRGVYSDFTPSKMVPGELAVVQSGDPNNTSGKAVYAAFGASGDVKRLASEDDLSGKVDKVTGKGLSTNDYTTAEKNKLSGIEAQANKTVIDSTLTQTGQAADAKAVGDAIDSVTIETDKTLTEEDVPADAKVVGDELSDIKSDLNEKASVIISSASGSIAHFEDGSDSDAVDVVAHINPVQSGSGDPSPTNVRPITGFTGMNITWMGANIWDEETELGTIDGNGNNATSNNFFRTKNFVSIKPDTSYYVKVGANINIRIFYYRNDKSFIEFVDAQNSIITTPSNAAYLRFRPYQAYGATYNNDISINYPATDHDYHAYTGQTYPITFPSEAGTVYGCYVDVTNGKLVVDRVYESKRWDALTNATALTDVTRKKWVLANTPKYTGSDANGDLISNAISYYNVSYNGNTIHMYMGANTSDAWIFLPTNTADSFVLELSYSIATTIEYDITPTQIELLTGVNNVWHDANGSTDVEYKADTKLYIEQLTKPTEDDMVANTAITSGKFFMIGNRLFISTSTIASGDTINPGTNCTELSLADALNSL